MMGGTHSGRKRARSGQHVHIHSIVRHRERQKERTRFVPDLAGIRALVVDDNPQAREILSDALRGFALRADAVSSGQEALQALSAADSQDPYQLVLMDWHMPGMDGLQASAVDPAGCRLEQVRES